jgi:hypothetical protein
MKHSGSRMYVRPSWRAPPEHERLECGVDRGRRALEKDREPRAGRVLDGRRGARRCRAEHEQLPRMLLGLHERRGDAVAVDEQRGALNRARDECVFDPVRFAREPSTAAASLSAAANAKPGLTARARTRDLLKRTREPLSFRTRQRPEERQERALEEPVADAERLRVRVRVRGPAPLVFREDRACVRQLWDSPIPSSSFAFSRVRSIRSSSVCPSP